jgi:hypothetical protein
LRSDLLRKIRRDVFCELGYGCEAVREISSDGI